MPHNDKLMKETATVTPKASDAMMHGIQIGAVSFVDEGTEKPLDILQQRSAVSTLYLSTFSYDRGIKGRGRPFPDHGAQESDSNYFHAGNYATPHQQFYTNTALKEEKLRAPDFGKLDIIAEVLPAPKKRGMKVICSIQDGFIYPANAPFMKDFAEVDLQGRKGRAMCFLQPDVREFWKPVATDLYSSYAIDGVLLLNERNGPLLNAIGVSHAQTFDSTRATCFCEHHQREAKKLGINFARAKEGYRKLDQFVKSSLNGKRSSDGYYVEFTRLLLNICSTVFRDVPLAELMGINNLLNYAREASIDELPMTGLSPDYVMRETQRAKAGVNGKSQILPGIDVNIPTGAKSRKASPDDTYATTLATFKGGADGVILSKIFRNDVSQSGCNRPGRPRCREIIAPGLSQENASPNRQAHSVRRY